MLLCFWGISILIVGPFLVLWAYLTRQRRCRSIDIATASAIFGVRLVGVKIEVVGWRIFEPGQNYIFMSNHVSNLDPPVLIRSIPGRCSVLVKKELFRTPILGTGMKQAKLVPVDRRDRESAIESVNAAEVVLQQGLHMLIYPEGTRSCRRTIAALQERTVSSGHGIRCSGNSRHSAGDIRELAEDDVLPSSRGQRPSSFMPPLIRTKYADREVADGRGGAIASALPPERQVTACHAERDLNALT